MRRAIAIVILLSVSPAPAQTTDPAAWLEQHGLPPVEYLLSAFEDRRIVIVGEAHWIRHDVELIAATVPRLPAAGVPILATELFPASEQERIDRLVSGETWNDAEAIAILRAAAWPYRQYAGILRAAWTTNRATPGAIRVIGLGPPPDAREKKIDYEKFMAEGVLEATKPNRRALVYAGLHHSFTRYHQPTVLDNGRADGFIDRTGNILSRTLGDDVFLVVLHRPFWCGSPSAWSYCLPAGGAIDCAAAPGGKPVGFDLHGSPFGGIEMDKSVYYAHGYPSLRMVDFADGWIWFARIEDYRLADLIPFREFTPDAAARDQVRANNPFSNEPALTDAQIEALWAAQAETMKDPLTMRRWSALPAAMERCARP